MSGPNPNPPIDDGADWEAIARYVAGEASPEERRRVAAWLAEVPARAELVSTLDRALDPATVAPPVPVDVERALARVRARIESPTVVAFAPRRGAAGGYRESPPWASLALQIAALVTVLVGGILLFSRIDPASSPPPAVAAAAEYLTPVGQRDSLTLLDGSSVLLAPDSRLEVAAGYGTTNRDVTLTGEAMFEVPHDDALPFRVRTTTGTIVDLGTAFAVRSTSGEPLRVVVTEGSVLLQRAEVPAGGGLVLNAGDIGTLSPGAQPMAERGAATPDDVAWTRGLLVLRDAPLDLVRSDLRRWYGLELTVSDSALERRHLTATFAAESPEEIARVIALALGADARVRGDTILIEMSATAP